MKTKLLILLITIAFIGSNLMAQNDTTNVEISAEKAQGELIGYAVIAILICIAIVYEIRKKRKGNK